MASDADLPIADLRRDLLAWYAVRRRALPWRERPSLYGTWISEIMLQQTTVAAVVPYWERFVGRFPDVSTLAAAPRDDVLALWSGLGYYRRGRMLHEAARLVVAERSGELPATAAQWRALPGVGAYAAGAIASIGLGEVVPAVDANARRVILRWLAPDPAAARAVSAAGLGAVAAALVDPQRPGDWNQAVMELGATHCRARQVDCGRCPVQCHCRARAAGDPVHVGEAKRRAPAMPVRTTCLAVVHRGRVLLVPAAAAGVAGELAQGDVVRDNVGSLHGGLFVLPQTAWYGGSTGTARPADVAAIWRTWLDARGIPAAAVFCAGEVRHAITRFRLQVTVVRIDLPGDRPRPPLLEEWREGRWPTLREGASGVGTLPISVLAARCLGRLTVSAR